MANKNKRSKREIELATFTHLQNYIETVLKRYSRPKRRFDKLEEALKEVGYWRLLLLAEIEGDSPGIKLGPERNES